MPSRKTAISVPEELFREIEKYAKSAGLSRSRFFADAAAEYLAQVRKTKLAERVKRAYANHALTPEEAAWGRMAAHQLAKMTKGDKW